MATEKNNTMANVTLIVGHVCKTAELRVNKATGDKFYSARIAENDKNGEAHFYSFTVKSENLAKYLIKGKYIAVAGVVKSREKDGYVNYDITGAQVKLLNQAKSKDLPQGDYTIDNAIADYEVTNEFVPADDGVPF